MTKTMNDILGLDEAKCREIVDIKEKYIKGELTFEEAREIILQRFDSVTPQEFAFGEQMLKDDGIDDETMHEKTNHDDIILNINYFFFKKTPTYCEGVFLCKKLQWYKIRKIHKKIVTFQKCCPHRKDTCNL